LQIKIVTVYKYIIAVWKNKYKCFATTVHFLWAFVLARFKREYLILHTRIIDNSWYFNISSGLVIVILSQHFFENFEKLQRNNKPKFAENHFPEFNDFSILNNKTTEIFEPTRPQHSRLAVCFFLCFKI